MNVGVLPDMLDVLFFSHMLALEHIGESLGGIFLYMRVSRNDKTLSTLTSVLLDTFKACVEFEVLFPDGWMSSSLTIPCSKAVIRPQIEASASKHIAIVLALYKFKACREG